LRDRKALSSLFWILLLIVLIPFPGLCSSSVDYPDVPSPALGQEDIAQGNREYKAGLYNQAIHTFMRVIQDNPGAQLLLMEAQWMLAKSYEAGGDITTAVEEYRSFLANFPSNPHRDEALLRLDTGRRLLEATMDGAKQEDRRKDGTAPPAGDTDRISKSIRIQGGQFLLFPAGTYGELDAFFSQLENAGMNTLIVRVFQNQGDRKYSFVSGGPDVGVYFKTAHAPVVEDILTPLVEMAHRRHLRLFAWMTTRAMDWVPADAPWWDISYDPVRQERVKSHRLDLFNPEAVEYLHALYRDLAAYPIDGIFFQDDLVYRHHEGFSAYAMTEFEKDFGVAPDPNLLYGVEGEGYRPLFWRWGGWKSRKILQIVDQMMSDARKIHPHLQFALNLNYETVLDPVNALAWLSQDLLEAVKYPFDYFSVMSYHRQMAKELRKDPEEAMDLVRRIGEKMISVVEDPSRVLLKIQTIDWDTGIPLPREELKSVSVRVEQVPGASVAFVFSRNSPPMDLLREVFLSREGQVVSRYLTNR
jgi:biofilm PGA synthesis lipoprotein PgaB